jgi:hypothetical protein
MRESQIQTRIKLSLEKAGWLVVKIIQTSQNGWPDLQAHKDGKTLFIECKTTTTKPTDLQLYVHNKLRKQGFEVIVARSTDDLNHHNDPIISSKKVS